MICYGLWYGGCNYAPPEPLDLLEFESIAEAKLCLLQRAENWAGYTPCVEESEIQLFYTDPRPSGAGDWYPDARLYFGPRGGIRQEPC